MDEQSNDRDDDEGEGILRPEDLGVDDEEGVEELGDNRYLISTDSVTDADVPEPSVIDPADEASDAPADESVPAEDDAPSTDEPSPPASSNRDPDFSAVAKKRIEPDLERVAERYAITIAAKTDEGVAETQVTSDSIVEVFERVLTWYGQRVDPSTPADDVIEILLAESRFTAEER